MAEFKQKFESSDPAFIQNANAIANNDDAESLREWLNQGMPADIDVGNTPLLHKLVEAGAAKSFITLAMHGAPDIDRMNQKNDLPASYTAVSCCNPKMLHGLLWAGANPQYADSAAGNLLHMAAHATGREEQAMEILDRLMAEGTSLHFEVNGKTPLNNARHSAYQYPCHIRICTDLDKAIRSRSLGRADLDTIRKLPGLDARYHKPWKDTAACWAWMKRIAPLLEKQGEGVSKADMRDKPEHLAWAVIGGSLETLDGHLRGQGEEGITMRDFVDGRGQPTAALQKLTDMWGEKKLMESEWVKQQPVQDFHALCRALPKEAKERVPNYHQLITQHAYIQSMPVNGRGR